MSRLYYLALDGHYPAIETDTCKATWPGVDLKSASMSDPNEPVTPTYHIDLLLTQDDRWVSAYMEGGQHAPPPRLVRDLGSATLTCWELTPKEALDWFSHNHVNPPGSLLSVLPVATLQSGRLKAWRDSARRAYTLLCLIAETERDIAYYHEHPHQSSRFGGLHQGKVNDELLAAANQEESEEEEAKLRRYRAELERLESQLASAPELDGQPISVMVDVRRLDLASTQIDLSACRAFGPKPSGINPYFAAYLVADSNREEIKVSGEAFCCPRPHSILQRAP